jgi:cyclophilin family peptidyl-prolyl cis-trans isomerase
VDRPLEEYVEILEWAAEPRAAIVTVERPGFMPGRFTVRLDTENAPLTAWNFAKLAEAGFYDGLPFHRLVPNSILQTGDPDGDGLGGPGYVIRDEIHPHEFDAGTLAMALPARDGSGSQWFVTLDASPVLARTHTAFGRVVQNFPGVVARVLPIDRVVSVVVYEGDGTEPLPPLERAGIGSRGVSAGSS